MNKIETFIVAATTALALGCSKTPESCRKDWSGISEDMKAKMARTNDCDEAGRIGAEVAGRYSDLLESCENSTKGQGVSTLLFTQKIHNAVAEKCD